MSTEALRLRRHGAGVRRAAATPGGPAGRLAALALALFAHASSAALFDDDEARRRIAETDQRLSEVQKRLEDRIAALETKGSGIVEVAREIELLKADMARLRGQIEVLTHELAEAQKRQRDLYVDLDSRLRRIESAQAAAPSSAPPVAVAVPEAPAVAPPPVAPPSLPPPSAIIPGTLGTPGSASAPLAGGAAPRAGDAAAAEQRTYDAALDVFKRGDYTGAIAAFTSFLKTYPRGPLASSAQYWIGNAHFARRDYRAAISAQRTLVANYPDSPKVPDALLNIASAQSELGDSAGARRTLEEIVTKHPQSEAAAKAKQRLAGR